MMIIKLYPAVAKWSNWTPWSICSEPCGTGKKQRKRLCDDPLPEFGAEYCVGQHWEEQDCSIHNCPG